MSDCAFPLISEKYDISSILEENKEDGIYQRKLRDLSRRYVSIRNTKGDGNCFYRALGFSYLEAIIGNPKEISRFKEIVLQSKGELTSAGFQDPQFASIFQTEVEAMAMECDHLQILALSEALAVPLQVEYVDDTDADVNYYLFPEATSPLVYMLFRRQHYNILYCVS